MENKVLNELNRLRSGGTRRLFALLSVFVIAVVQGCAPVVVTEEASRSAVQAVRNIPERRPLHVELLWEKTAEPAGTPGGFIHPTDVAINPEGYVVVTDSHRHRVQLYRETGEWVESVGRDGHCEECLLIPSACHAGDLLSLYVADEGSGRIMQFHSLKGGRGAAFIRRVLDGQTVADMFAGSGAGFAPIDLGRLPNGDWVVLDRGSSSLLFCDPFWRPVTTAGGKLEGGPGRLLDPRALTIDTDGSSYVCDAGTNRIIVFDMAGVPAGVIGRDADLNGPAGIANDGSGLLFVADTFNNRVVVLDRDGLMVLDLKELHDEAGELLRPEAVAVSPDGILVVADTGHFRILCFRLFYQ